MVDRLKDHFAISKLRGLFIWTWGAYLVLALITPQDGYKVSFLAHATLWGHVLLTFFIACIFAKDRPRNKTGCSASEFGKKEIVPIFLVISLIGLGFHLYDKIFILGLEYDKGICFAKNQWVAKGLERSGAISSAASAIGHLTFNLIFVSLFFLTVCAEKWSFRKYLGYHLLCLVSILIYSGSIGNRTIPLILYASILVLSLWRKSVGLKLFPFGSKKLVIFVASFFVIFSSYFVFIFYDRARCEIKSDVIGAEVPAEKISDYRESFVEMFGGQRSPDVPDFDKNGSVNKTGGQSRWRKLADLLSLSGLYIVHTQWTYDQILKQEKHPGSNLINSVLGGMVKIGMLNEYPARSFSSRLLHLPGSIFYSFGFSGLILFSILWGLLLARIDSVVYQFGVYGIIGYFWVGLFNVLAPLTSAANLMGFPYLCICSAVILFLHYCLSRTAGAKKIDSVKN